MANVSTPDVSSVTMQQLHEGGLNPYAVELLVESYANPRRGEPLAPIEFVWRGVVVSLHPYEAPVRKVHQDEGAAESHENSPNNQQTTNAAPGAESGVGSGVS